MPTQYLVDLKEVMKCPTIKSLGGEYSKTDLREMLQACAASKPFMATRTLKLSKAKFFASRTYALEKCILETEKQFKAEVAQFSRPQFKPQRHFPRNAQSASEE
jgi:hypothetical protein